MAHERSGSKSKQITGYVYVGDGDYLHSVPARDLTVDEYAQHRALIEANVKATGRPLYVPLTKGDKGTGEG